MLCTLREGLLYAMIPGLGRVNAGARVTWDATRPLPPSLVRLEDAPGSVEAPAEGVAPASETAPTAPVTPPAPTPGAGAPRAVVSGLVAASQRRKGHGKPAAESAVAPTEPVAGEAAPAAGEAAPAAGDAAPTGEPVASAPAGEPGTEVDHGVK